MDLKKYIKIFDNILPLETISSVIKYLNQQHTDNQFKYGQVGNKGNIIKKVRDVQTLSLNLFSQKLTNVHYHNLLRTVFLTKAQEYINEHRYVESITEVSQIDALRYSKNNFYNYHVDDGNSFNRILSCILFLNNDYENGDLCFKFDEEEISIKPIPSRLIMWPSNFLFPHCVKPVSEGIRYSIVAWMR